MVCYLQIIVSCSAIFIHSIESLNAYVESALKIEELLTANFTYHGQTFDLLYAHPREFWKWINARTSYSLIQHKLTHQSPQRCIH